MRLVALLATLTLACAADQAGQAINEAGPKLVVGNYLGALRDYDEVVRIDPKQPAGPYGRGLALRGLGRTTEAIAAFQQSIRVNPDYLVAYLALGRTQEAAGMRDAAIATFADGARRFPDSEDIRAELSFLELLRLAPSPTPGANQATPESADAVYEIWPLPSGRSVWVTISAPDGERQSLDYRSQASPGKMKGLENEILEVWEIATTRLKTGPLQRIVISARTRADEIPNFSEPSRGVMFEKKDGGWCGRGFSGETLDTCPYRFRNTPKL